MVNSPIVDDRVDLRIAGEWTKRNGYSFNEITNAPIDGRDLWSGRVTLGFKPTEKLPVDYARLGAFLRRRRPYAYRQAALQNRCVTHIGRWRAGVTWKFLYDYGFPIQCGLFEPGMQADISLFTGRISGALRFLAALRGRGGRRRRRQYPDVDPYASTIQSQNLRVIESTLNPRYQAKNDVVEFNADYAVTPTLTVTSQTGYNQDFLSSTEDYNRFDTSPGIFAPNSEVTDSAGVFCDPQLGCSNRLVANDLSNEHAWQLSQEFRLSSNFSGPFNFSFGGNYLHYETEENYYVFINSLTMLALTSVRSDIQGGQDFPGSPYVPGVTDNHLCLQRDDNEFPGAWGFQNSNPAVGGAVPTQNCIHIDPNPLASLNNEGHNYFLSQNPYTLNSYAGFGEAYYNIASDLKLTGGLRWTEDKKHFLDIPSELAVQGYGYFVTDIVNQQWDELTGRAAGNWTPKLDFTDQTLIYGSYARGYKAGGANPPGAVFGSPPISSAVSIAEPIPIRLLSAGIH